MKILNPSKRRFSCYSKFRYKKKVKILICNCILKVQTNTLSDSCHDYTKPIRFINVIAQWRQLWVFFWLANQHLTRVLPSWDFKTVTLLLKFKIWILEIIWIKVILHWKSKSSAGQMIRVNDETSTWIQNSNSTNLNNVLFRVLFTFSGQKIKLFV